MSIGSKLRILTSEQLGAGGYGKIYKAVDEFEKQCALKCIDTDKDMGIPCLMEAAVMKIAVHPNINSALAIHTNPNELQIFQPLADADVVNYIYDHGLPSDDLLRLWSYQLIHAVSYLHQLEILHCDIKGNNVLVFGEKNLKLSDFTLARKMSWGGMACIGTCTHRALEVWLGRDWHSSVDIWSLGCTLIELATGHSIFPSQSGESFRDQSSQYINCHLDWAEFRGESIPKVSRRPGDYERPNFESLMIELDRRPQLFKDLVLSMLRINKDRPTATQLIEHEYFRHCYPIEAKTRRPNVPDPIPEDINRWMRQFPKISSQFEKTIREHAIQLMNRLKHVPHFLKENECLCGSIWIAMKLITGEPPRSLPLEIHQILAIEKMICSILQFYIA